ncbi:hypothetical protein BRADI_2g23845v3 [Brachypodium distachyon]|uniref:Uncharacterized protein n=1 Tax=Brachypodium distachyon TaxID=15368 RepID=A0A0Q3QXV0_BRADI|nr:hypothetical protein BRADI_2g23845v3 [Brachypodium distachyon]
MTLASSFFGSRSLRHLDLSTTEFPLGLHFSPPRHYSNQSRKLLATVAPIDSGDDLRNPSGVRQVFDEITSQDATRTPGLLWRVDMGNQGRAILV